MKLHSVKSYRKSDIFAFLMALVVYFCVIFAIALFFIQSHKSKKLHEVVMVLELLDAPTISGGGTGEMTMLARTFGSKISLLNLIKTVAKEEEQTDKKEEKIKEELEETETKEEIKAEEVSPPTRQTIKKPKAKVKPAEKKEVEKADTAQAKPTPASKEQSLTSGSQSTANSQGAGEKSGTSIASEGSLQNIGVDQERRNLALIRQAIERHKKYPPKAEKLRIQGMCTIEFLLLSSGEVRDIKILQSSGKQILNEAALQALKEASSEFPRLEKDKRISFELKFTTK